MSFRAASAPSGRLSVFHNRNFTLLWSGSLISNSGSWMQMVAQGWLVWHLSGSPFLLGLIGFSRAVPIILLAPFGGVVADRVLRLRLLKITQTTSFLLALVQGLIVSLGVVEIWQLALISVLSSGVNAFDQPTRQALLPDLVKQEDLGKAVALNSSVWQGSALFGPALAGVTVATIGVDGAFYINALSFLAVVAALFMMRGVPERHVRAPGMTISGDLFAGFRFVRSSSFVLTLLVMASLTSIFGRSYQQLMPVFADDVFHRGSAGLGLMLAAPGAGTLVGAAGIAMLRDVRHKGRAFLVSLLLFSATLVLFSVNRSFELSLVLLFFSGLAALVFSTMMTTMLQIDVPNAMRGRVMALVTVTFQGFQPMGSLLTGALASAIGTPEAVAGSAVVVAVAAVVAFVSAPSIRRYSSGGREPWSVPAEAGPSRQAAPLSAPDARVT